MVFRENKEQKMDLFDPINDFPEQARKRLAKSWGPVFYEHIFLEIDEMDFSMLFEDTNEGRPNFPINVIVGALILKEYKRLTDEELIDSITFNMQFRTALGCSSYLSAMPSERTISRFRMRMAEYDIEHGTDKLKDTFDALEQKMKETMGLSNQNIRMDSAMIQSNIKSMGRVELMYTCIKHVIDDLLKEGIPLPDELKHYQKKNDLNRVVYHENNEEINTRHDRLLKEISTVLELLPEGLSENRNVQLMDRMIREQTVQTKEGELTLRPSKEISSTSLQNPSDPDATYRKKAGKGYKGYTTNFCEIFDEGKSLIEDYSVEQNVYSDTQFSKDVMEKMCFQDERVCLYVDGAYGGAENRELAEKNNIELIAGNLQGRPSKTAETDGLFVIDEKKNELSPLSNQASL